jgi:hypothetical protein
VWEAASSAGSPARHFAGTGTRRFDIVGDSAMTAIDLVGLLLIAFLVVPMVTARPSQF